MASTNPRFVISIINPIRKKNSIKNVEKSLDYEENIIWSEEVSVE